MNYVYLIKEYFFCFVRMTPQRFRFVRMTPQRFEHLLLLVGPHFGGKKFQCKHIVAELAGIFVECSFKFISGLKAYDKIS